MGYQEIEPSGFLRNFIRFFWKYEHINEDIEYTILPDACFDLLADFEDKILQNIIFTGIWTKPIKVIVTKGSTLLAVRFKIIAAEYLFQREIKSLLNTMVSLPTDFWNINSFACSEFEKFTANLSHQMMTSLEQLKNIDNRKLKPQQNQNAQ